MDDASVVVDGILYLVLIRLRCALSAGVLMGALVRCSVIPSSLGKVMSRSWRERIDMMAWSRREPTARRREALVTRR